MSITLIFIWILIFLFWFVYRKYKKNFDEFESYGLKYMKPWEGVGSFFKIMLLKITMFDAVEDFYRKFSGQKVAPALSILNQRVFLIRDPTIIKQIAIKDFDHFVNHDKTVDENLDPVIGKNLFTLRDESWRKMRNSLSPIFTSSKMKMMFGILSETADDFVDFCNEKLESEGKIEIDCKSIFVRFAVDGISTAVLGFKADCLRNEKSQVYEMVQKIIKPPSSGIFKILIFVFAKWLYKLLKLKVLPPDVYEFFKAAIVNVMKEREEKGIFRPDVIELLMRAKRGQLAAADKNNEVNEAELSNFSANPEYEVKSKNSIIWTDDHFIAQGHLFFSAGLATSSVVLETVAYYLAVNKNYQNEIIKEVDAVENPTYEAIHKMKFLDMFISEVLRLWASPFLNRECNKDYKMDFGDGIVINVKNGDFVQFPVWSIHHDEKYFPNPEVFDPYRFSDERKGEILNYYMPFGIGPRICIASRFALMEVKVLIFKILSKFTFEACEKTPKKLKAKPSLTEFQFTEDIIVELKPRDGK
ncbi:hypothetical protein PVAND_015559 [Polypedilum vanderplanki]|uniref:Cytochrome P450 monooxygenase n=1 Tax=Polypedilum vanderplanki TaxID=319348 RepID=A0A9J6BDG4_POLVA|nr:hypothetical protein PVAND_015559 [Polypedilum vanderplanki]